VSNAPEHGFRREDVAAPLVGDALRWRRYVLDALVETTTRG
jgi:hypothetical protein